MADLNVDVVRRFGRSAIMPLVSALSRSIASETIRVSSGPVVAQFAGALYSGFTPTFYAAPADLGNGSGSSEANAMDLPTALATVTAGGIVGVLPGVYSGAPSDDRWDPIFKVTSTSGSAGNPIRVVCKYPAVYLSTPATNANRTELQSNAPAPVATGPNNAVIGSASGASGHVHFYGFYIDMNDAPPRASNGTVLAQGNGNQFHQFHIDGMDLSGTPNDNYNPFYVESADDVVIKNNRVQNIIANGNQNFNVVVFYGGQNFLVEHNEFITVHAGIFAKGSGDSNTVFNSGTIRFNKISSTTHNAISVNSVDIALDPALSVYQNILINGTNGNAAFNFDASSLGDNENVRLYNNTIVNHASGGLYSKSKAFLNSSWYNNIVYWPASSAGYGVNSEIALTGVALDYNYYFEAGGGTNQWYMISTTYSTLANWRTATGKEANSAVTDPQFVNPASDWHLQGGSPALTAGNTGGPIGAYITGTETIGVEAQ